MTSLAEALAGKHTVHEKRANGRVHRLGDEPEERGSDPTEPIITPLVAPTDDGELIVAERARESRMPKGQYPRKKKAVVDEAPPPVAKRRGPKPGSKRKARTAPAVGEMRFLIDDQGGISITPDSGDPIHLDADATKRLELFLNRTKDLRK